MRTRRIAAATIVAALIASVAVNVAIPVPRGRVHGPFLRPLYPAVFPAGSGKPVADRACTICHSPMLTTQQAKDSAAWQKTVKLMESWGAPVLPAEHDTLIAWLVRNFGARSAH